MNDSRGNRNRSFRPLHKRSFREFGKKEKNLWMVGNTRITRYDNAFAASLVYTGRHTKLIRQVNKKGRKVNKMYELWGFGPRSGHLHYACIPLPRAKAAASSVYALIQPIATLTSYGLSSSFVQAYVLNFGSDTLVSYTITRLCSVMSISDLFCVNAMIIVCWYKNSLNIIKKFSAYRRNEDSLKGHYPEKSFFISRVFCFATQIPWGM